YLGALMAWLGFTLPSVILMTGVALLGQHYIHILNSNSFHTIQLIVFSVIAWAFWQMLRGCCKTAWQYAVLLLSVALLMVVSVSFNQILVIMLGAICGLLAGHFSPSDSKPKEINKTAISSPYIRSAAAPYWSLAFILPFILLPLAGKLWGESDLQFFSNFYQTGSLVFGGGHVILPLLHQDFVTTGLVSAQSFDLGYAFAQLMPGPL